MTNIDAVAEAICRADPNMQGAKWPGKTEAGKDYYRGLAQAALDAMESREERGVCYYHIDGEPVLEREHGGGMAVLTDGQSYTDWGGLWAWYVRRVFTGPWEKVEKPAWARSR